MQKLIFRNRWIALVWALGLLMSTVAFFGEGGGSEQLDQAATQIRAKRQPAEPAPVASPVDEGWDEDAEEAAAPDDGAAPGDELADSYVVIDSASPIPEADIADYSGQQAR